MQAPSQHAVMRSYFIPTKTLWDAYTFIPHTCSSHGKEKTLSGMGASLGDFAFRVV